MKAGSGERAATAHGEAAAPRSSCSPACPARASRRRSARSRTSATSASTTCRRRSFRRWPSSPSAAATSRRSRSSSTCAKGTSCRRFRDVLGRLRRMRGLNPVLIFLEASNAALVRRFSETRRPHPLARDRSASEGIRDERARLTAIREMADEIVDTSDMTVHELRQFFMGLSRDRSRARPRHHDAQLRLQARRAGGRRPDVRRALPAESAFRAGAAAAHRPRPRRGRLHGARPGRRASSSSGSRTTCASSCRTTSPKGKSYLTVAIGCTGGRHRSVMIAERLRSGSPAPRTSRRGSGIGTSGMHDIGNRELGIRIAVRRRSLEAE